ncbi:MAG: acyltransferase [Planctomycetales bacterium]|nr:acyltransferase [Planctomycetales bacterium]
MQTIDQKMSAAGHRPAGFDYLRILLAVAVVFWHSFGISYGIPWTEQAMAGAAKPFVSFVLPAFFALSGFLVAGSLARSTLTTFAGLRIIRIAPALGVEVVISALVIGPLLTTVSLGVYFSDPRFWAYFLNAIGKIQYVLPGMFPNNPIPDIVNGQLWTVPWELKCYLALGALALVGAARNRWAFLALGGLAPVLLTLAYVLWLAPDRKLTELGQITGWSLVLSFLGGVLVHQFRALLPHSLGMCALSLAAFVAALYLPFGEALLGLPIAYVTVYLGVLHPPRSVLLRTGDYSYGIFLYGYIVQQAVAQFGPWTHHWYVNFPLSLAIVGIIAAMSWHAVEKPALALRHYLPLADRLVGRVAEWCGRSLGFGDSTVSRPPLPPLRKTA